MVSFDVCQTESCPHVSRYLRALSYGLYSDVEEANRSRKGKKILDGTPEGEFLSQNACSEQRVPLGTIAANILIFELMSPMT